MSNPMLNENTFNKTDTIYVDQSRAMTINGTMQKTLLLLLFVILGSFFSWSAVASGNTSLMTMFAIVGVLAGFILCLVISLKRHLAAMLSPVYAICEGLFLGGISAIMEAQLPGIVIQAVAGTFVTMLVMLALYMGRVITVTDRLRSTIISATFGIAVFYLVAFILSFFGIGGSLFYGAGILAIGINALVIIIAAFNLLLDFDIIERGVNAYAPKYMEWYCSFGLLVTLVWLYLEILKLLSRLNRR